MNGHPQKFNYGVALLKLVACFGVISMHFGEYGVGRRLAVPTFLLVGFYLSAKLFAFTDIQSLLKRLYRFFLPFAVWGVFSCLSWSMLGHEVSCKMVLMQFACGRAKGIPAEHLYYLEVCIIITVMLYVLPRVRFNLWLIFLVVVSFVLQHSGINYRVFSPLGYNAMNTFGRVFEFVPYACAGVLLSRVNAQWTVVRNIYFLAGSVIFFILASLNYILKIVPMPPGFHSQGGGVFLLTVAICVPIVLVGFEKKPLGEGHNALRFASSLTGGMYYIHMLVGTFLVWYFDAHHGIGLTAAVFVCSACITAILQRIRYVRRIVL